MAAVMLYGGPLIDDPERLKTVNHMGVDETMFQSGGIGRRRSFVTAVSDLEPGKYWMFLRAVNVLTWQIGWPCSPVVSRGWCGSWDGGVNC
jgi:hypothetical protein